MKLREAIVRVVMRWRGECLEGLLRGRIGEELEKEEFRFWRREGGIIIS